MLSLCWDSWVEVLISGVVLDYISFSQVTTSVNELLSREMQIIRCSPALHAAIDKICMNSVTFVTGLTSPAAVLEGGRGSEVTITFISGLSQIQAVHINQWTIPECKD